MQSRKKIVLKRLLSAVLAAVLSLSGIGLTYPAYAAEYFTLDMDNLDMNSLNNDEYVAQHLSADTPGLCVQKYISDSNELAVPVRLTVTRMDTKELVYDKNYGNLGGTFNSGILYLSYAGNYTVPYLITLYISDWVFAVPFMHTEPRLEYNSACTYGVPMQEFNAYLTDDWLMGTMIDLDELRQSGSMSIPVFASNAYVIGEAKVSLWEEALTVTLAFYANAQVELYECNLYCIQNVGALTTADPYAINEPSYGIGQAIPVDGASTMLLYIPMFISYNSAGMSPLYYDGNHWQAQQQKELWNRNLAQVRQPVQPIEEIPAQPDAIIPELEWRPDENILLPEEPTQPVPEAEWQPQALPVDEGVMLPDGA